MARRHRIAILMHERDSLRVIGTWIIARMADMWRDDGHEVVYLFGTRRFVPADIVIVHVDLSVVPASYLAFAARYPVAVNGRVADIRKRTVNPSILLGPHDPWRGPVMIKTDLNHGGRPEWRRSDQPGDGRLTRTARTWLARRGRSLGSSARLGPAAYRVVPRLADVPSDAFAREDLVVQKFLAERDGPYYCVRHYSFLGDRESCVRLRSTEPVVNGDNSLPVEAVEVHPAMVARRHALGFDYGKFDFVVVDGEAILLDANKTIGTAPHIVDDPELVRLRRYRAAGLYAFLR